MSRSRCSRLLLAAIVLILASLAWAEGAAFDLAGPQLQMSVSRAGKELPISQVPNLQPQDRLWVKLVVPPGQTVHYLMVVAFLRGSSNPPPEDWFTRVDTWEKKVQEEGVTITVPEGAQQAMLFLAPTTGGDFNTLRATVRGRPGAFVRASQDLNRASLDRSRLDRYLAGVREVMTRDAKSLHDTSTLLARSLNIKLDQQCFDKPSEQQAPCLMQNQDQLVLEDGHSQSMVSALTSGPGSDLIGSLSNTKPAGAGAYSPYVGAVLDVARIMENLRTAQFQYIPALSLPGKDKKTTDLKLNNPPSFRKPKSVMVVGLPPVEAAQLPPLRAVDAKQTFCLQQPSLVLPVEGAPLVFSTRMAHDLAVQVETKSGQLSLPVSADPARGGLAIDTKPLDAASPAEPALIGRLRGNWGFQSFDGPSFQLQNAHAGEWTVAEADKSALVVGRDATVHLSAADAACVKDVSAKDEQGKALKATWKLTKPEELEVKLPLAAAAAGSVTLAINKHGLKQPDEVALRAYAEPGRFDDLVIHAGDRQGVLMGTRLDQVASLELKGVRFLPAKLSRAGQKDELRLAASDSSDAGAFAANEKVKAKVALKDGRVVEVQTTVESPRPKVTLLSKSVQPAGRSAIRLANQEALPQDARLSFFVKAEVPSTFPRNGKIEVATEDDSAHASLTAADGTLTLQDPQTAVAVLDPVKSLGPSAFGALRFRVVDGNGATGDWQPLAKLVRVPALKEVRCPDSVDRQCSLVGSNLFLIDAVAADAQFAKSVPVPAGFANATLAVPRPNGTLLYLKLRDDPEAVNTAVLPVLPEQ